LKKGNVGAEGGEGHTWCKGTMLYKRAKWGKRILNYRERYSVVRGEGLEGEERPIKVPNEHRRHVTIKKETSLPVG